MVEHRVTTEPQPIAEQIIVKCSCGWRQPVCILDHDTRQSAWNEVTRLGQDHLHETRAG